MPWCAPSRSRPRLSRQHNNSNVLAVGARVVGPGLARMIVHDWLTAEFEGGRHARRVALIEELENQPRVGLTCPRLSLC